MVPVELVPPFIYVMHYSAGFQVPIYGIVENMTEFICPACGHHSPLFGHQKDGPGSTVSGGDRLAEATGLSVLARIPIDPELIQSADAGKPLMFTAPQSELRQRHPNPVLLSSLRPLAYEPLGRSTNKLLLHAPWLPRRLKSVASL
ncbi:hypothetical protein CRM22_000566 [Opisthorchis felineus]|uniref:Uncharacterized protein n=1 Tax=Opisthorchis felineus TaxID=147828 RepID=A0A4S2MIY0_OPIFE|nr:hypothetical protein CRM22_000566 [Opisthorchis felineus]